MAVSFHSQDISFTPKHKRILAAWLESAIVKEKKLLGEVSIIFCSDNYLLDLNRNHLKHDYYTDVITFDYSEGSLISGDIFISVDRVKENAKSIGVSFPNELHRVMVHGTLHLLGHMDKSAEQRKKMTTREDFWLRQLAFR